jgi:hypothetical protein
VVTTNSSTWYRSTVYNAASTCVGCGGTIRHERWCRRINAQVRYAFDIAAHAECLTREDDLRLHALGIVWMQQACGGQRTQTGALSNERSKLLSERA